METELIISIGRQALYTIVHVAMPLLLICLVLGIVVSILQSVTQIQENTLSFIPKMLGIFFGILLFMPYMYKKMLLFVDVIVQSMINLN